MRVLFSAHGAFGHVLPMIGLGRALQAAGHEVLFATSGPLDETVRSLGLQAIPAGMNADAAVAEARRRWPQTQDQAPGDWAPRMFSEIAAPRMLSDLLPIVESFRPDLVVREEGEHAGPVAAAAAGIAWITHGWGSPLPNTVALGQLAEGLAALWCKAGSSARSGNELYGRGVLDPCPASLYGQAGPPRPVTRVRPSLPRADARTFRPPTSDRRLAYVGFGTVPMYRDRPELIETVTSALLSYPLDAIITTPDTELASKLAALAPGRVHTKQWVSLPDLFEACDLVVSHGGAGTALAALASGVPLLLLPLGAPSQGRMGDACMKRGVAPVITDQTYSRAAIDEALASLTTDDRYRVAARELAEEIKATPGPEQLVSHLEALAAHTSAPTRKANS
jgi:UDP:flavonoid glycosyltransferase YjiC (YdhE family)